MILKLYCLFSQYVSLSCGFLFFGLTLSLIDSSCHDVFTSFYYVVWVCLSCGWLCD